MIYMIIREVECKSILTKSKISNYAVNCYVGCMHSCVYCYARYMKRFTGHNEPWGQFVDVKINSPDILKKQVKKAKVGEVFMSSACDGWQQIERKYRVSRQCLKILLENGFHVSILTKSCVVEDDLDIIEGSDTELGFTLTTFDDKLCRKIEPKASLTKYRIETLKMAKKKGIKIWAFLGPFMPFLSDTDENIDSLFSNLAEIGLDYICVDKLNPRPCVWESIKAFLIGNYPYLLRNYGKIMYDQQDREKYINNLKQLILSKAKKYDLSPKISMVFS